MQADGAQPVSWVEIDNGDIGEVCPKHGLRVLRELKGATLASDLD